MGHSDFKPAVCVYGQHKRIVLLYTDSQKLFKEDMDGYNSDTICADFYIQSKLMLEMELSVLYIEAEGYYVIIQNSMIEVISM